MGEFFGSMYTFLFEDFFGLDLAEYLWGTASPEQATNMFIGIGLTMLLVSLAIGVIFYYAINHPRLNNWWGWLIFLGVNAIVNFLVGWQWVLRDFYAGKMFGINKVTQTKESLGIDESNILAFGFTNMILGMLAFILISYIIKWGSSNCSRAPF